MAGVSNEQVVTGWLGILDPVNDNERHGRSKLVLLLTTYPPIED